MRNHIIILLLLLNTSICYSQKFDTLSVKKAYMWDYSTNSCNKELFTVYNLFNENISKEVVCFQDGLTKTTKEEYYTNGKKDSLIEFILKNIMVTIFLNDSLEKEILWEWDSDNMKRKKIRSIINVHTLKGSFEGREISYSVPKTTSSKGNKKLNNKYFYYYNNELLYEKFYDYKSGRKTRKNKEYRYFNDEGLLLKKVNKVKIGLKSMYENIENYTYQDTLLIKKTFELNGEIRSETEYIYDENNMLKEEIKYTISKVTNKLVKLKTTKYKYDNMNRIIQELNEVQMPNLSVVTLDKTVFEYY